MTKHGLLYIRYGVHDAVALLLRATLHDLTEWLLCINRSLMHDCQRVKRYLHGSIPGTIAVVMSLAPTICCTYCSAAVMGMQVPMHTNQRLLALSTLLLLLLQKHGLNVLEARGRKDAARPSVA
jgi:hypothetical protein